MSTPWLPWGGPMGTAFMPAMPMSAAPAQDDRVSRLVSNKPSLVMIVGFTLLGLLVAAVAGWAIYTYVLLPSSSGGSGGSSSNDCQYGSWTDWIGCDAGTPAECGSGVAVRMRTIAQEANANGAQCDESQMVETMPCTQVNAAACANLNCSYSDWSPWSTCPSQTCESSNGSCGPQGVATRTRNIVQQAQPDGVQCDVMQTFQYAPCNNGQVCPEPVDCVPQAWSLSVWSGCPTDICWLPGQPTDTVWEYQYRGIAVPAQNGGADCSLAAFVQSQTCQVPQCTSCTVLLWGSWSTCDVPCSTPGQPGTTWQQADAIATGSYFYCDTTSVSTCTDTSACPVGSFLPPVQGSFSADILQAFQAPNSITLYELLALCGSEDGCAGVNWNTGLALPNGYGYGNLLADTATLTADDNFVLYLWDATSPNCVAPTWPMLDAECLNLCSGGVPPTRARVYPFAGQFMPDGVTPALSCPVTVDLLAAAGACTPDASGSFTSLSCPNSSDCVYQDWLDASPWSTCNSSCGYANGGGGTRQRTRNIVSPPAFMGAPCDPNLVTEYTTCNSPQTVTDAPGLVSFANATSVVSNSTAALCATSATTAAAAGYSFMGVDTLMAAAAAGQELFFATPNNIYNPRATIDAVPALVASAGYTDWRYAGADEVVAAYALGAQWCQTGFTGGSGNGAIFPMQEQDIAGCGPAGIDNYSPGVAGGLFVGTKPSEADAATLAAATGVVVKPFTTWLGSSSSLTAVWSMPDPSVLGTGLCLLHDSSVDTLLSTNWAGNAASTFSYAADAPCAIAVPCSLSAWQDITECPACGPPYYKWQTCNYVAQAQNGGAPCSTFPTKQSVSCSPVPPACADLASATVYGPWPSYPAVAASGFAYKESWDVPIQAAWIQAGAYDALDNFNSVSAPLPQDLADALNVQCLNSDGSVPLCIATPAGNTYTMMLNAGSTYTGWASSSPLPEVFAVAPTSASSLADVDVLVAAIVAGEPAGTQLGLATNAELAAAQAAGAQWCMLGYTEDGGDVGSFPMQIAVAACGNNVGVNGWAAGTAGATLYGVKPDAAAAAEWATKYSVTVWPWFQPVSGQTAPATWSSAPGTPACATDSGFQSCLGDRPACAAPQYVYSPAANACIAPSQCPYVPAACSWSNCSAVCEGAQGVQSMIRGLAQMGTDFDPTELIWDTACTAAAGAPACAIPCPLAADGSMCGSLSGHGVCDTSNGSCSCTDGAYETVSCWFGCPVDGDGNVCSGQGTCNDIGECVCNAGYGAFDCSVINYPVLFNMYDALGISYPTQSECASNWQDCNVCLDAGNVSALPFLQHLFVNTQTAVFAASTDTSYISPTVTCASLGFQSLQPLQANTNWNWKVLNTNFPTSAGMTFSGMVGSDQIQLIMNPMFGVDMWDVDIAMSVGPYGSIINSGGGFGTLFDVGASLALFNQLGTADITLDNCLCVQPSGPDCACNSQVTLGVALASNFSSATITILAGTGSCSCIGQPWTTGKTYTLSNSS